MDDAVHDCLGNRATGIGIGGNAGIPPLGLVLGHTFSVLALQNSVDIKTLSSMLGHYSAEFTLDTYAHMTTAMQTKAANTVNSFLSGAIQ